MAQNPEQVIEAEAPNESAEDESARLRARIEALEAELKTKDRELSSLRRGRRREGRSRRDLGETARDVTDRVDDQGRRFFRAMVLSQLEQLRLTAEVVGSFAEGVAQKSSGDDPDADRDLPGDIYEGYLDAIDRALEIPEKAIETFRENYKSAGRTRDN